MLQKSTAADPVALDPVSERSASEIQTQICAGRTLDPLPGCYMDVMMQDAVTGITLNGLTNTTNSG